MDEKRDLVEQLWID